MQPQFEATWELGNAQQAGSDSEEGRSGNESPGNWALRKSQVSDSEEDEKPIYVRVTLNTMDGESIGIKTFELDGTPHEPSLGAILAFARTVLPDNAAQKNKVANVIFSSRPGPGGIIQCIERPHRKIRLFINDLPTVPCGDGDDTDNSPVFSLLATVLKVDDQKL